MTIKLFRRPLIIFVPIVGLALFLALTNPYEVPLATLLIPFVLLFWLVYMSIKILLSSINRRGLISRDPASPDREKSRYNLTAIILASIIVLIAVLQSIQQLTVRDVLLTTVLLTVTVFYIKRLG